MKLSQLHEEAQDDLHVDEEHLESKSLQIASLHSKWLKYLHDHALEYRALEMKLQEKQAELWKHYREDYDYELSQKEIQMMVDADEDVRKLKASIYTSEQKVKYIEGVIKSISQLSFNIRNAIEWHKFKNGMI